MTHLISKLSHHAGRNHDAAARGLLSRLWQNWQDRRTVAMLEGLDYSIQKDIGFRR